MSIISRSHRFRIALAKILLAVILASLSIPAARPVAAAPNCSATPRITSGWDGAFTVEILLTNTGTTASSSWVATWAFPDSSYVITLIWNLAITQSGASVRATNLTSNGIIAPGGTIMLGFMANHSGTSHTMPSNITVTCT